MEKSIQNLKKKIIPALKRHKVNRAAVFGSFVRGETKKTSDIDILVKFEEQKSLLDLVRLQFKLEEKLRKKVDLLTYDSIHPFLRNIILKEQKIIYEKRS